MKNKSFNPSVAPRLLAVALFFAVFSAATGQEVIRESPIIEAYSSIIRSIRYDSVIAYNSYDSGEEKSFFTLLTPGVSNPYAMFFDSLHVSDFEIFEKRVYFCGYKELENSQQAMFGFFEISQFPNSNIVYYIVEDCKELKRIDAYHTVELQFMEESHLVMTGTSSTGGFDVLLDVIMPFNAPFYSRIYISENDKERFDDVAVTENYVVISSRNEESGIPVVNYLQFERPQLLGQDIFSMIIHKIQVSSPVSKTQVLLEYMEGDKYASVYKNSGYPQIEMTLLSAPSTINSGLTILNNVQKIISPLDIKYNHISHVYDILARDLPPQLIDYIYDIKTQIYHVTSDELGNISTYGKGTKFQYEHYPTYRVMSIDPLNTSYFVATGEYSTGFTFYRYKHNLWEDCPGYFEYPYVTGKPEGGYVGTLKLQAMYQGIHPLKEEKNVRQINLPVICGED